MKYLLPVFFLLLQSCGKEQISLGTFREIAMPVSDDLSAVWFADAQHGSISGGKAWVSGFLLSSADGGESWSVDSSFNRKMEHVTFSPDGQGYACGQDAVFFREPNAAHWQLMRVDYQWLHCAHFPGAEYGAIVSGEGFHGGQLRVFGPEDFWRLSNFHEVQGELAAVWYADSLTLLAVGAGWVIRSADAGQTWERLHLTGDFFTSVHFPDARTGYICGSSGNIFKTTDGGVSWQHIRKGGIAGKRNKGFQALWFSDADHGWLVGDKGIFWHTENGGDSWQQVAEAPRSVDFTDVFVRNGKGWATGKGGRFFLFELN